MKGRAFPSRGRVFFFARFAMLIFALALGILTAPLAAEAQKPVKVPRIGVLSFYAPPASPDWQQQARRSPFWQAMRELGWIEGQTIVVERRWAEGRPDRLPALATELVQLKVDLIFVTGGLEIAAAKKATDTIPIVMGFSLDAVQQGFVASLAHPGGNVTGMTTMTADLNQKRLELLKETVPGSSRMTVLACKGLAGGGQGWEDMQVTARALGIQLQRLEAREPDDYDGAFATAMSERAEAMLVFNCYFNGLNAQRIVDLAAKHRVPVMYNGRLWVDAGGLMSYAPNIAEVQRRAATYVDKILKGAKPGDLPVEQPMQLEFIINLKTAQALGIMIPPSLLILADEVIK